MSRAVFRDVSLANTVITDTSLANTVSVPEHMFRNRMRRDDDHGQATVEFALTLPLVVLVVAFIIQVTTIAAIHLEVVAETGRVARAASMAEDPASAARTALNGTSTSTIDIDFDSTKVTISVTRRVDTDVALIGRFVPDVVVRSSLTMAREPFQP